MSPLGGRESVRFDGPLADSVTSGTLRSTLKSTVVVPSNPSSGGIGKSGARRLRPMAPAEEGAYAPPAVTVELFATVSPTAGSRGAPRRYPQMTRSLPAAQLTGTAAFVAPSGEAELDSMWMAGFLDFDGAGPHGDARGVLKAELGEYERLFGVRKVAEASVATPAALIGRHEFNSAGARAARAEAAIIHGDPKTNRGYLSGVEIQRLRVLEARARSEAKAREVVKGGVKAWIDATPYARENGSLQKVLALRGEAGGRKLSRLFRPAQKLMTSAAMDNLLWLERLEAQAAVVIQRIYRKHLKRKFWKQYRSEMRGALSFQIAWRRYWIRKVAKKQKALFSMFATKVQAVERGRAERRKTLSMKQQMHEAAADIQRVWRGFTWRRKAKARTRKRQLTKILRMWRGVKGRAIADRRFLDVSATQIQRTIRGCVQKALLSAPRPRACSHCPPPHIAAGSPTRGIKSNEGLDLTHARACRLSSAVGLSGVASTSACGMSRVRPSLCGCRC